MQRGEARERYLLDTLAEVAKILFGAIEMRIKNREARRKAVELLKEHNMEIIFSAQPIQLYNEDHLIAETDISSIDEVQRKRRWNVFSCSSTKPMRWRQPNSV